MNELFAFLNGIADSWLRWMANTSLQLALLGAFLALLCNWLKNFPPRFRYWLWFLVIFRALIPTHWLTLPQRSAPQWVPISLPMPMLETSADPAPVPVTLGTHTLLFVVWSVGVTVFLLNTFWRFVQLRKLQRKSQPFPLPPALRSQIGIPVRLAPYGFRTPFATGMFRPIIFLPQEARNWSQRELQLILEHEMAHIRQGDLWMLAVQQVFLALFFFHPVAWLTVRQLNLLRESACDEAVLRRQNLDGLTYSRFLLNYLQKQRSPFARPLSSTTCFVKQKGILSLRFHYLIHREDHTMKKRIPLQTAVMTLALAVFVLAGFIRCSREYKDTNKQAPADQIVNPARVKIFENAGKDLAARFDEPFLVSGNKGLAKVRIVLNRDGRVTKREILHADPNLSESAINYLNHLYEGFQFPVEILDKSQDQTEFEVQLRFQRKPDGTMSLHFYTEGPPPRFQPQNDDWPNFTPFDSPPAPVGGYMALQKNLHYPEEARRAGIEETVILQIYINKQGIVEKARPLKGKNEALVQAAIQAAKATRWKPAQYKGKTVSVAISVPFIFKLRSGEASGSAQEALEKEAEPVGGFDAIQQHIRVPKWLKEKKRVMVKALVTADGKVKNLTVINSSDPELSKLAVDAVRNVRWKPAERNGTPVSVWVTIPIVFKPNR